MPTDLIIGMASGYTWADLAPFAVSLRRCGYSGRCVLIVGQGPQDVVKHYGELRTRSEELSGALHRYGIEILDVGKFDEHPSIARAYFIANFLNDLPCRFRYVVCADTKDVAFQTDPTEWLTACRVGSKDIVTVSEMQRYGEGDMVGNNLNMVQAFGPEEYSRMLGQEVVNGGIIAGRQVPMLDVASNVFSMCVKDRRRTETFKPSYMDMLPDQSALNILIRQPMFSSRTFITHPTDGFAFGHPLARYSELRHGVMYPTGCPAPYSIFHQYFNTAEWWNAVRERYSE